MAVIRHFPGLGWRFAGIFSLLAVVAPAAQGPRAAGVSTPADIGDRVPAVAPAAITTWSKLLAANGRPSGRERLVVVDADGAVLAQIDGEKASVLVPAELSDRLRSPALSATLIHNHPDLAGFSTADVEALTHAGVRRVVAIAADGTTFEATAGPSFADAWASTARADLPARVRARIVDEALREGVPPAVVAMHAPHVTALVLRRLGIIDYRVSPSITARLVYDRNRSIFDRVVDAETGALAGMTPPAARSGR